MESNQCAFGGALRSCMHVDAAPGDKCAFSFARQPLCSSFVAVETPPNPTPDSVNHPAHYTAGGIECIDAIAAATVGLTGEDAFCTGCAVKYLFRWKRKGGVEDLRKAVWYINRMISRIEAKPDPCAQGASVG